MESNELELSIVAGNIVANALQLTRNLFCPYCAQAFMFEFTLKDHLKKSHPSQILQQLNVQGSQELNLSARVESTHACTFCGAVFVHFGLIPKHIREYHGAGLYQFWEQQDDNKNRVGLAKENEPSILYADGSPGLSDVFERMNTLNYDSTGSNCIEDPVAVDDNKQLKSILKKTPRKSRIICSPSSAAIRRTKSDVIRRNLSARRELRFDPSIKNKSPTNQQLQSIQNSSSLPGVFISSSGDLKSRKPIFTRLKNPFNRCKTTSKPKSALSNHKLVTSTPINLLDDDDDNVSGEQHPQCLRINRWKATIRKQQPLFFASERFQCAFCRKCWENNADLLFHLSAHHRGVRRWLRPQYRCSQCGVTFYSNSYLVRHCHEHHTPGNGGSGRKLLQNNSIR